MIDPTLLEYWIKVLKLMDERHCVNLDHRDCGEIAVLLKELRNLLDLKLGEFPKGSVAKISDKRVIQEQETQEEGVVRYDLLMNSKRRTVRYNLPTEEWEERSQLPHPKSEMILGCGLNREV